MSKASIVAHIRDILILPFTVTVIVPYLIHDSQHGWIPESIFFTSFGVLIGSGGLLLFLYTVLLFKNIGQGTLAPWSEKHKLVVVGPYRYCRNPMITGVLFILIGEAFFLYSNPILVWAICFFIINTVYFVISEEPKLEKKFGEDYRLYKQHVSRWIPRFSPYRQRSSDG
ncbi:MAG TPA: isoprenylcysteine carboxylmethyltransferase family protein [Chryseolinea sp.]